jgi:hypothetical protein
MGAVVGWLQNPELDQLLDEDAVDAGASGKVAS